MEGCRLHKNSGSDTVSGGLKGKPTISMAAGFCIRFGGDMRILGCSIFARNKDRTQSPQAPIGFGIEFGGRGNFGFWF